ncbi:cellulose biosynthesis protein BcsQ [Xanthomonas sacchari]|uniref:ParA family protein n=1 Tax=unclassified Xanthomonas TaxID=2643310 RepID=UPI00136879F2|nr:MULTISPECIES: ParA family protein [unclassified Xanthomonas]MBB6368624.1 cellulose biosynthesis protein BcsQ [Xanthomonas sp. F10]MXV34893.1 ParA family protein [Xanthomonas sp. LMG 8989]
MSTYAFWNNKGGVGKSFLCFIAACEYSYKNPDSDVYVIDLCPQANVSEMILGGQDRGGLALREQLGNPGFRKSVGGYIEQRLNSPFQPSKDAYKYVVNAHDHNSKVPKNLGLICGDNLVEVLGEAVRQTSQLSVPFDAWKKVILWIEDLKNEIEENSLGDTAFFIDCNPSFAVYTQLAIAASDYLVVPFTADESSRRGMENIIALLYGQGDDYLANFSRLSFFKKAKEEGIGLPKLHTFISNKSILFDGKPSKASKAATSSIIKTVEGVRSKHRSIFAYPGIAARERFIDFPDYHAAAIVSSLTGTPMHKLKAGPKLINGHRIQINPSPLQKYNSALSKLVEEL